MKTLVPEEKIIVSALKKLPKNELELNALKRQFSKAAALPSKTKLLSAYHNLLRKKSIAKNSRLEKLLVRRRIRTLSGVSIVTSLTKPYPCPGNCVYCPFDARMPKSYLADEPAASRALALEFDPYDQMMKRLQALRNNGHATEKIELIVKGGTWNAYPLPYQYWFILESFRSANENGKRQPRKLFATSPLEKLKAELQKQQQRNERSKHRLVGLTLETRPDSISEKTLWQMREQGCTRLELGVQHTDDQILNLVKRGHTVEHVWVAMEKAKQFGFKVDFHLMPQLPGSTPETDLKMLQSVFTDPGLRPDMIKIYPCTVVKGSELYSWLQEGRYKAYPVEDLIDVLVAFKPSIPYYVRVSRLIRDIPGQHIENGNKITNLRQVIQSKMKQDGTSCRCLRCREAGHVSLESLKFKNLAPKLFVEQYETRGGTEYFLSFEDEHRQVVFAFCRLRIDSSGKAIFPAFIRELHTYGQVVELGKKEAAASQHRGFGKKLVKEAEKIVRQNKVSKLAVISGVGVRDYYRHLGYRLEKTYLVKKLAK